MTEAAEQAIHGAEKPTRITHTAGPWEAYNTIHGWAVTPVSGGGTGWASFGDILCESYLSLSFPNGDGGHRSEANARLIAAAPDLLEALQELLATCGGNGPVSNKARVAIAKATGAPQ